MQDSGAKVLVTQPDLRKKIVDIIPELFDLQHILIVNKDSRDSNPIDPQDLSYEEEMGKAPAESCRDSPLAGGVPTREAAVPGAHHGEQIREHDGA